MKLNCSQLKIFLEEKHNLYNRPSFIETDPIAIPHRLTKKEDIELAGFLSATIAWGQRPVIVRNASKLIGMMDDNPHDFILNASEKDMEPFNTFVHRTFNGLDCHFFLKSLKNLYLNHGGLEAVFTSPDIRQSIVSFRDLFFGIPHLPRTQKHVSNPDKGASAKRILMFLRWMVRKDNRGVDFGIWKGISPSALLCPLDVHSGNVARKLGLLQRKQNDWKAVEELTANLRKFDSSDPVKYDFALFGLGVFERF